MLESRSDQVETFATDIVVLNLKFLQFIVVVQQNSELRTRFGRKLVLGQVEFMEVGILEPGTKLSENIVANIAVGQT